jgi:hypothetical protein
MTKPTKRPRKGPAEKPLTIPAGADPRAVRWLRRLLRLGEAAGSAGEAVRGENEPAAGRVGHGHGGGSER